MLCKGLSGAGATRQVVTVQAHCGPRISLDAHPHTSFETCTCAGCNPVPGPRFSVPGQTGVYNTIDGLKREEAGKGPFATWVLLSAVHGEH
jgi:hypothetical protein